MNEQEDVAIVSDEYGNLFVRVGHPVFGDFFVLDAFLGAFDDATRREFMERFGIVDTEAS